MSSAVATRPHVVPMLPTSIAEIQRQAEVYVSSGLLPKDVNTWQKAVVIMQTGNELGIPPMTALRSITVINGKPSANANLLAGLIQRTHGDDALIPVTIANDKAIFKYKRRGWSEYATYEFTIDDAKRAGITNNPTWTKYPKAMLRSRCISAIAQTAFQDTTLGIYTPEEMGASVNEDGDILPGATITVLPTQDAEPERTVDTSTGEIIVDAETRPVDSTGSITQAQKDQIKALLADLNQPFSYANQLAKPLFNKPVVRLTQAEGQEIIHRLDEECHALIAQDAQVLPLTIAAAEKGITDEGELRYALALLFTDFPDDLEEWTAPQIAHAAGWFAGRDAEAVKAAIDGAE